MIYPSNSCPFEQTVPVYEKKNDERTKLTSKPDQMLIQLRYNQRYTLHYKVCIFKHLYSKSWKGKKSKQESPLLNLWMNISMDKDKGWKYNGHIVTDVFCGLASVFATWVKTQHNMRYVPAHVFCRHSEPCLDRPWYYYSRYHRKLREQVVIQTTNIRRTRPLIMPQHLVSEPRYRLWADKEVLIHRTWG